MGTLLVSLFLFLFGALAAPCSYTAANGISYDLSALSGKVLSWSGLDPPAGGFCSFTIGVCSAQGNCSTYNGYERGAVCQRDDVDAKLRNCGMLSGFKFFSSDPKSGSCLGIEYHNGQNDNCPGAKSRSSKLHFVCDPDVEVAVPDFKEEPACTYNFWVKTKHACPCPIPNPSPSAPPPRPSPPVFNKPFIRVGNAMPSPHNIDVVITQGSVSYSFNNVAFAEFTDWVQIFEPGNGTVDVYESTNPRGKILVSRTFFLPPGPLVVAVRDFWPPTSPLVVIPIAASWGPPLPFDSTVRMAHLVPNAPHVSLFRQDKALVTGLEYPQASEFQEIPAGQGLFRVVVDATGQDLLRIAGDAPEGYAWSIYLLGLLGSSVYPVRAVRLLEAPLQ